MPIRTLFFKKLLEYSKKFVFLAKNLFLICLFVLLYIPKALCTPIKIFTSQHFTGQLAKEIGEEDVLITAATGNVKDPHHFEITIGERKALADANIVILNGLGYETWTSEINNLQTQNKRHKVKYRINTKRKQKIIVIANLLNKNLNDDPHLWYEPEALPLLAKQLCHELSFFFPENRAKYKKNLQKVLLRYEKLNMLRDNIRKKYTGTNISATEPVFFYMAQDLKLNMLHKDFQQMIMNHGEPSVAQISTFEQDLKTKTIKVLLENIQTHTPFTKHFVQIAKQNKIPVVAVSETLPENVANHAEWMIAQLSALQKALRSSTESTYQSKQ